MRSRNQIGAAKTWILAFIVLAGGGFATLVGVGCLVNANTCPFREAPKQTTTDGPRLFLTNCAACHGRDGEGRNGPSLVRSGAPMGEELVNKISRGKPLAGMPRFSRTLSDEQIRAIAAFIESALRGGSPSPSPSPS